MECGYPITNSFFPSLIILLSVFYTQVIIITHYIITILNLNRNFKSINCDKHKEFNFMFIYSFSTAFSFFL